MIKEDPDRIEREIRLRAPVARVWRAISNTAEFGDWFGVKISGGEFVPGARVRGQVTHQGYEHLVWDVLVERVEPERLLSWRWHPHAIDPKADYAKEPTTLVTFELEPIEGGTRLRIVESGFASLPEGRRMIAYRGNGEGWTAQVKAIERHVAGAV